MVAAKQIVLSFQVNKLVQNYYYVYYLPMLLRFQNEWKRVSADFVVDQIFKFFGNSTKWLTGGSSRILLLFVQEYHLDLCHTTIYEQFYTGDITAVIRREEQGGFRDFVRAAHPPHRYASHDARLYLLDLLTFTLFEKSVKMMNLLIFR